MNRKTTFAIIGAIAFLLVGMVIGMRIGHGGTGAKAGERAEEHAEHVQEQTLFTCAMHPQIKLPRAGKCPICFMDLVPLSQSQTGGQDDAPNRIAMSPLARKLAAISTTPAVRRGLSSEVRLSGKVAIDETRQEVISSRFMGRIDRLYVNATGVPVRKGDHLAEIYSPDLIAAQQELLSAANALSAPAFNANPANTFRETLTATKEKLRLLGFSETDIDAVLSKKAPSDHMTMRSSQGGIVLEKMAVEGAYIEAGMPVYLIADLSMVWVKLDAYESDIAWLKPGQKVEFTVEAWPGEAFSGVIHLIDPVIDPMTRTVKVRVEAPNSGNRLKPEMMVRAIVRVDVSASGKVLGKNLRGKWMCPMHPNIVKSGAGTCDICAMPLEPAESLGYGTSGLEHIDPLVIPATAPLITGERAIVYVQVDSSDQVIYEGREVVLGPRAGDYYVVKSGLAEGEKVVVNGVFQIDSELQIRAKKSMMNPGGGGLAQTGHAGHGGSTALAVVAQPDMESKATPVPVSPSMIKKLAPIFIAYFESADNLSRDDLSSVKKSLEALSVAIDKAESDKSNDAMWKSITAGLGDALLHRRHIESLADARGIFEKASAQIIRLAKMYPGAAQETRYIAFCPMAFDGKGAYWLQKHDVIANPYFGPAMLKCGEIKEIITNPSGKGDASNVND